MMPQHSVDIRVRYKETDKMGVTYYANYLVWFEVVRTELFRKLGMPYTNLEKEGIRLMVVEAHCKYKSPTTYDDLVKVEVEISDMKNTSISFSYKVYKDKKLAATGETVHVFTDKNGKPMRIPEKVKNVLSASV